MTRFRLDPKNGLPIPTLGFPADLHSHLKKLGYDYAGGLEYDWGDCAHAVSRMKLDYCRMQL